MRRWLSAGIFFCLFAFVSAKCQCTSSTGNIAFDSKGSTVLNTFPDYTSLECEGACCEYPSGKCVGYSRLTTKLAGTLRGECVLFGSVGLSPTPGYVFVQIVSTTPTCQLTNIRYHTTSSGSSTTTSGTYASCTASCCAVPSCQGFTMPEISFADGSSNTCFLWDDVSSSARQEQSGQVFIDVSGCSRQPASPDPLVCSSGDPSLDNLAQGLPLHFCDTGQTICPTSLAATDGILTNSFNPTATPKNTVFLDFTTTQLVGIVTIFPRRTQAGSTNLMVAPDVVLSLGTDYPTQGFVVMVGDGIECTSRESDTTPPDCPVCERVTHFSSTFTTGDSLTFDCRGLRGQYLTFFAPGESSHQRRAFDFAEVVVQPAPFFPNHEDPYPLYSAQGCCNKGSGVVPIPVSQLTNGPTKTFASDAGPPFTPWVQVSLGPVAVPVGVVSFAFPGDLPSAQGMFHRFGATLYDDGSYVGFIIGVNNAPCPTTFGIGGNCPGSTPCATVSKLSFGDFTATKLSEYRVDCRGVAGKYVFVQLVTRPDNFQGVTQTTLSVQSLKVSPPSRIAPAIYPARADLLTLPLAKTVTIGGAGQDNAWTQATLTNGPAPVGLVQIATTSISNLVRQRYLLADIQDWVDNGNSPPITDTAEPDPYYGIDNGAIVGVSSTPCGLAGCTGLVCDIITSAPSPAGVLVDCRGAVGSYVYVMLPQSHTVAMNAQRNPALYGPFPERDPSIINVSPYEMVTTSLVGSPPQGEILDTTNAISAFQCEITCRLESLCRSWYWSGASALCTTYLEFVNVRDNGSPPTPQPPGSETVLDQVCRYRPSTNPILFPDIPYTKAPWTTFPPLANPSLPSAPTTSSPTTKNPTTHSPTTVNPTSQSPTTQSPTTLNPTTLSPTTLNPTTQSPTTVSPTTLNPTTNSPTTNPTTLSPTTLNPTTQSPTTVSPTTLSPTTHNPTTQSPTTVSPTTFNPTTQSPTTQSPTTLNPTTLNPTTRNPTTQSPSTISPTSSPTVPSTRSPSTLNPTTRSPSTLNPTTRSPSTLSPTTRSPSTLNPTTRSPSTLNPTTRSPSTLNPTTRSPSTLSPTARSPSTRNPTTRSPSTLNPTTRSPSTLNPTTRSPSTRNPTTRSPSTLNPTTRSPSTLNPTTRSPSTRNPTTRSPSTLNPTTRSPSTLNPTTRSPSTRNPTTRSPSTLNPTTRSPSTRNPSTLNPTTRSPSTLNPSTRNPSTRNPSTRNPSTLSPTTRSPTRTPTLAPTRLPTMFPSLAPTRAPTQLPTSLPTQPTTAFPTVRPTTARPTRKPSTALPTRKPSLAPTTRFPVFGPTRKPTRSPTGRPTRKPTRSPTGRPTRTLTPTPVTAAFCAQRTRCYDCTMAGCDWVQSSAVMGCVPDCSGTGSCRTTVAQCPESRDTDGFCAAGRCGGQQTGCSCISGCGSGCCTDFEFACP